MAIEVNDNGGLGDSAVACAELELLLEKVGINVPGHGAAIHKYGGCPEIDNGIGTGGEGQVRTDDLIVRPDPEDKEGQVKRCRAASQGGRVSDARFLGDFFFKRVDVRTESGYPI